MPSLYLKNSHTISNRQKTTSPLPSKHSQDYLSNQLLRSKNDQYYVSSRKKSVTTKKKKKQQSKKMKKSQSYTGCLSMKKLCLIAQQRNQELFDLIKIRQKLLKENIRMKYHLNNLQIERSPYFLEQIQKKKLELRWQREKINSKHTRYQQKAKQIQKDIQSMDKKIQQEERNRKFYLMK